MPTIKHLINYFQVFKLSRRPLYILCLMMLFWALYDGTMSYLAPILIVNSGLSKTLMGIIVGTSSVAGALFDFVVCQLFTNTHYRRLFMIMFAVCLVYPLILFGANTFVVYLIAMAMWGVYFDLKNIANFDYVGRYTDKREHTDSFGLLQVFSSMGYLIAPIIVGLLVAESVDWRPAIMAWIFLVISIFFFAVLCLLSRKIKVVGEVETACSKRKIWAEVKIWSKIGKVLLPVLLLTFFLNFFDAFFWTIGPLLAESLATLHRFAGFFMVAYTLPALLVGWFVGAFTRYFGKKRTAFTSLFVGSVLLSLMFFIENPVIMIIEVFISSLFISMSWPAINGTYADYISETAQYEKEIEGLEDFYTNLGYIFGPILSGFIADRFGNTNAFVLLGLAGVLMSIALLLFTPKKITIKNALGS